MSKLVRKVVRIEPNYAEKLAKVQINTVDALLDEGCKARMAQATSE